MKFRSMLTLTAVALAVTMPVSALAAGSAHDHHGAHSKQKLELNAGKKWATDDALRKGMTSIRSAVTAVLPAAHEGKTTAAEYDALAKELGTHVGDIVQNCKLDAKTDAQLHLVLEHIISGIDTVEGKTHDAKRAQGVVKIAQALNTYGKHFDHAGWQAIKLPH